MVPSHLGYTGLHCFMNSIYYSLFTLKVISPIPSIPAVIISPTSTGPTPEGVPIDLICEEIEW
jgi:hypothetical protein